MERLVGSNNNRGRMLLRLGNGPVLAQVASILPLALYPAGPSWLAWQGL